jgi:hypothetical protein
MFLASDDSAHITGIELMVDGSVAQYLWMERLDEEHSSTRLSSRRRA